MLVGPTTRELVAAHRDGASWTGGWTGAGGGMKIDLAATGPDTAEVMITATEVSFVVLRWDAELPASILIMADAWERSYGELQWRHRQPERMLPWYWLGHDQRTAATTGAGVDVGAGALCGWTVGEDGVSLWLDLRNGAAPTVLAGRTLLAARLRRFADAGTPWRTLRQAVARMASGLPSRRDVGPVVGANNWYYAYGEGFDEPAVLGDARTVVELADNHPVRPFSVIDDGWNTGGAARGGPWDTGGPGLFDAMGETAARIRETGARPGVWFRPLLSRDHDLAGVAIDRTAGSYVLDPSTDQVLDVVRADLARFADWGFDLVKHDFSTFDVFGRFGPSLVPGLDAAHVRDRWCFADRSRTTAEIITAFYTAVREAAGELVIIGCNTVGHLAAGLVDLQRTGDDTSGRQWERSRRMGINTLAFRLPQHDHFFTVDADCVPLTPGTPWSLNRQLLDLVARSGTALFVSIDPAARTAATDADLATALRIALDGGHPGSIEPLDWLTTTTPNRWRIGTGDRRYRWSEPQGATPGP